MTLCTECYIQQDDKTLMLYRNKKEHDINEGKWLGVGGKFEPGETPEQCLLREVQEETGVTLTEFKLHGVMTFVTLDGSSEPLYIFIFTASAYTGVVGDCDEGTLAWIDTDKVPELERWEGDHLFWEWIVDGAPFFSAYFEYDGDVLSKHSVTFY
ncbi:MAG: 8-oxo-dGTP diphosphatase [Coriobacteriia bacterium]|nr:8-oxo-dGTP diphosphatase [Coriobacteriia bacterium]